MITAGPDGNLWFVEQKQNGLLRVGKITVSGVNHGVRNERKCRRLSGSYPPVGF